MRLKAHLDIHDDGEADDDDGDGDDDGADNDDDNDGADDGTLAHAFQSSPSYS